jgi:hypothetical protein
MEPMGYDMRNSNWHPLSVEGDPCNRCNKRVLCEHEQLACPAFLEYVIDGEPSIASTVPTKEIYMRVFGGVSDAQDHALDVIHRRAR